jgi:hypothetical protein
MMTTTSSSERQFEEGKSKMGPSIRGTNTRRRNSENDGQILLGGGSIGITVTEPKRGFFQEDGRNGRLPQSMRETNDEAVHTPRPRE